jgi:hypothetical protein
MICMVKTDCKTEFIVTLQWMLGIMALPLPKSEDMAPRRSLFGTAMASLLLPVTLTICTSCVNQEALISKKDNNEYRGVIEKTDPNLDRLSGEQRLSGSKRPQLKVSPLPNSHKGGVISTQHGGALPSDLAQQLLRIQCQDANTVEKWEQLDCDRLPMPVIPPSELPKGFNAVMMPDPPGPWPWIEPTQEYKENITEWASDMFSAPLIEFRFVTDESGNYYGFLLSKLKTGKNVFIAPLDQTDIIGQIPVAEGSGFTLDFMMAVDAEFYVRLREILSAGRLDYNIFTMSKQDHLTGFVSVRDAAMSYLSGNLPSADPNGYMPAAFVNNSLPSAIAHGLAKEAAKSFGWNDLFSGIASNAMYDAAKWTAGKILTTPLPGGVVLGSKLPVGAVLGSSSAAIFSVVAGSVGVAAAGYGIGTLAEPVINQWVIDHWGKSLGAMAYDAWESHQFHANTEGSSGDYTTKVTIIDIDTDGDTNVVEISEGTATATQTDAQTNTTTTLVCGGEQDENSTQPEDGSSEQDQEDQEDQASYPPANETPAEDPDQGMPAEPEDNMPVPAWLVKLSQLPGVVPVKGHKWKTVDPLTLTTGEPVSGSSGPSIPLPQPGDPTEDHTSGQSSPGHIYLPGGGYTDPTEDGMTANVGGGHTPFSGRLTHGAGPSASSYGESDPWVCPRTIVSGTSGMMYAWCPYSTNPLTGELIIQMVPLPLVAVSAR